MLTYADSTPLARDRDALRARLREHGYLFFRRLIDPADVRELRAEVLSALSRSGWLDPDADPAEALPGAKVRLEEDDDFYEGYANIQRGERFHRLAHAPALRGLLQVLVDDEIAVHPQKIARASFPHSGFTTPPHQDFRYIQGTPDTFTTWLPLGDCPPELGGLRVLSGSQDNGLLPIHSAAGAGGLAVDADDDDPDWASVDYRAGDVVLFHSLTVHAAIENRTDRMRLSVDYRYQSAAEPMARRSLSPHFFPHTPDWAELTRGWASRDPISSPAGMGLTEFGKPAAELALPSSRFVRVPV